MSTITVAKESHVNPDKFRIKYKDANAVLGPHPVLPENDELPVLTSHSKITIIGGGFGGIGVALKTIKKLKETDFTIFEKHDDLGGTWYANSYPGCASDIPAVWYSFSDELNTNWSDLRPPQYEMEEYIQSVVNKYGLKEKSRLHTQLVVAKWNEEQGQWDITARDLKNGQKIQHSTKILVNCTGGLVVPNVFNPPGMENFKGDYMHSATWNYDVSFKGKKVVVVGNGCSAAQVLPALLKDFEPESVTQLVRSQHYVFPPHPKAIHYLYRLLSFSKWGILFVRWLIAFVAELRYPMFTSKGVWSRILRWINTRASLNYMKRTIPEKYHEALIPTFKIGCKRLIFDYFYCPSLNDPRVDVVCDDIVNVTADSIVLKGGRTIKADVIVACTGYNIGKSMAPYKIIGRDGVQVDKIWTDEGASAYETILVRDMPNLFLIIGPNAATGHSSVVMAIENGCTYYSKVAPKILDGEYKSICVKTEKYYDWFNTTQERLSTQVFGTKFGGCVSWYSTSKSNSTTYPFSQLTMWRRMRNVQWQDLELVKNKSE